MKKIILHVLASAILFLIPSFNFAQAPELAANNAGRPVSVVPQGIEVYPNPTSGIVTVRFNEACNGNCNDNYVLNVVDITGKLVFNSKLSATTGVNLYDIDLSKEGKGIYLLKIKSDNIKEEKKIIVL